MRYDTLPSQFAKLAGKVTHVRRVNSTEWSSSCPQCGGTVHKGGDAPDRFRMWTNASGKNKIMGWCRKCSYVWFPDGDKPMNADDFERWRKEQIEVERRKEQEAQEAIRLLQSQKLWEFYHSRMNEWGYKLCAEWGIPRENVEFWKLGMVEDYTVYPGAYHSPAISIPSWGYDWEVRNIKLRVLNPQSGHDRYRNHYKVGMDFGFIARPDLGKTKEVIVVEGEKKAMVVAGVMQEWQVIGLPSVTPSARALSDLDGYDRVVVCLDPDAREKAKDEVDTPQTRLVKLLGIDRVQVVNLFGKVDDMIVKYDLDFRQALRYAKSYRKVR